MLQLLPKSVALPVPTHFVFMDWCHDPGARVSDITSLISGGGDDTNIFENNGNYKSTVDS